MLCYKKYICGKIKHSFILFFFFLSSLFYFSRKRKRKNKEEEKTSFGPQPFFSFFPPSRKRPAYPLRSFFSYNRARTLLSPSQPCRRLCHATPPTPAYISPSRPHRCSKNPSPLLLLPSPPPFPISFLSFSSPLTHATHSTSQRKTLPGKPPWISCRGSGARLC